jgi:hypothetical protein
MGRKMIFRLFALILMSCLVLPGQALAEDEKTQFLPILAYRTGPFAAGGSGFSMSTALNTAGRSAKPPITPPGALNVTTA